ncbi:FYVE [Entamoeba marina]
MSKELLDLDDFEIIDLEGNKTELDINVNEVDNQQNEQQQIPLDQRSRIVNEIFETEENYVEGLKLCIKYYYEPLMENNIIPRDKLEIIFLHFPDVCKMNSTFFEKLQSYKKDGVLYGNIGSAFVEFSHFFKVYKMVVGNSEAVLAVLKDVCSSQQVSRYLEQKRLRINAKSQLDLRSYLITPVQRLPRYNLLLNELLKHTEEEHPDYANIIEAIKCIKECTQFANDSVRERERRDKLITISQAVEGASSADIVKPNRVFLKSGHLIEIGKKVQKKRFFYLFTDLLMYGNGDEKKLTVLGMYNIESLIVKDVKDSPNSQHCFRILNLSNSEVDLTLRCDGEDSKKNWMNILTTAVQDERSRLLTLRNEIETSQTMVWIPDEEANECMRCGAQFTLFFRKHHCRNCGYVICSNCRERCKIPKLNRVDYVCTKCYSEILQDSKSSHPSQPSSSPQPNSTPQQPSPQNIADTTSSPDHSIPHENPSNTPPRSSKTRHST